MSEPHIHASHPALINRLKRANGHLASVIAMLEEGRSCVDVAQQLQAVEKAIQQAKKTLIQDHIPDGHPNSPAYGHLKLPHLN